jgi:hypothetical protein
MGEDVKLRLLLIVALLALVGAVSAVRVTAFEAVKVYDYGFTNNYKYVGSHVVFNKSSTFTQDDRFVIAYVTAALYEANLTARWYDPTGQLYYNQTYQEECDTTPCTFFFYLAVTYQPAAARLGLWRMDLLAAGFKLYSAYFSITPITIEDDYWKFNVTQSAPPRVHGDLTVTIHPDNQTWSSYGRYIPYAVNVTAYEPKTNHSLHVTTQNTAFATLVVVNLGGARSGGYTFVLSFDLNSSYSVSTLNGWYGGTFAFSWQDEPWERIGWQRSIHPTPDAFSITLPKAARLMDMTGSLMTLDYNVTGGEGPTVSFSTTILPEQGLTWTTIYQDFTYRNSTPPPPQPSVPPGLGFALDRSAPVLPITLGGLSLWTAIMSVFLLTAGELILPTYASRAVFNRMRFRIAALILVGMFIVIATYVLVVSSQPLTPR